MELKLLGLGLQGRSPRVSAQKRTNLYLEFHPEGDKTSVSAHGTPGLALFYDFGETPIRAMHGLGDYLYIVHRGTFWRINNAGVAEEKGTLLSTAGPVGIADNGFQIMIVDGAQGYIYTLATEAFAQISDADGVDPIYADFPGGDTVTFLDGYFIVNNVLVASGTSYYKGRFYISALYDGTKWTALGYATAESSPDNLVRVLAERSLLYLFGDYSTEAWSNTGALDFPFSRMQGAAVEWGLAARASVVKFDDSLCWLARNRLGQVSVVRAMGLQIERVSTQELDYLFSTYAAVSDATAFGYMLNGHPCYVLNFPSASRSFLYDGLTGAWSDLVSYGLTRYRGETQTNFLDNIMIGDFEDGRIFKLRPDVYTEDGSPIVRQLISPHRFGQDDEQMFISEIRLDMETGRGLAVGQGSDPQVMLQVSRDGGHSFSTERWTSAGKTGQYRHRARWRRLGRARDMVLKLTISDPIPVNLVRASADIERGAS